MKNTLNTGKSMCNGVFLVCSRKIGEAAWVRAEKVRAEWRAEVRKHKQGS